MLPSVDHNLLARGARGNYGRRAEGGNLAAGNAPEFLAILHIESGKKRILLHVSLDDYHPIVDDGRTRESPLRVRHHVEAGIEDAQVFLPLQLAIEVEDV